jgi:NAD(P)-dependent dehydrogenase (short-subunit alcohol dehydrogenase family)
MKTTVVIGATGDVGSGIVRTLLQRRHAVIAIARNAARLDRLRQTLAGHDALTTLAGSLASDAQAQELVTRVRSVAVSIDAVVVSVNAPRQPAALMSYDSESLAALINRDLITHFTAARSFIPHLPRGATFVGIGGGSCDFVLHEGVPQSVAQAGLRMLYRGLAHEYRDHPVHLHELIIASVVNGVSTRANAEPQWVTDLEIGEQVAAIIENPAAFAQPILRLARRDASGRPVFSEEAPTRVQGFKQP